MDLEMEFFFAKCSQALNAPAQKRLSPDAEQSEQQSPLILGVPCSAKFKGDNSQPVILQMSAKLKNSYTLDQRNKSAQDIELYSHMLIGRVKDTPLMFSFFIEASIIVE